MHRRKSLRINSLGIKLKLKGKDANNPLKIIQIRNANYGTFYITWETARQGRGRGTAKGSRKLAHRAPRSNMVGVVPVGNLISFDGCCQFCLGSIRWFEEIAGHNMSYIQFWSQVPNGSPSRVEGTGKEGSQKS